jgi:hypothetical protein
MTVFTRAIKSWLHETFPKYHKHFMVRSDFEQYNKKEDESVYLSTKGIADENCEVYLKITDDRYEYVCDIATSTTHIVAERRVITGLNKIKTMLEKEAGVKG